MTCTLLVEPASRRIAYVARSAADAGPSEIFLANPEGKRQLWNEQLERHPFDEDLPADLHAQNCSRWVLADGRIVPAPPVPGTGQPAPATEQIQKFDDFLPPDLFAESIEFARSIRWRYGWTSTRDKSVEQSMYWHVDFDGKPPSTNVRSVAEKLEPPFIRALWERLSAGPFHGHTLVRCYANGHTYGVAGAPHIDRKQDGFWSLVFYAGEEWQPAWAGETVFFDRTGDICNVSLPRPNRLVVFPSNILHAARGVERFCPALRICFVFKTRAAA
jgi:hypothetical protein